MTFEEMTLKEMAFLKMTFELLKELNDEMPFETLEP